MLNKVASRTRLRKVNGYPRFGWVDILRFQHIINKFQIIKRKRNFTTDEKEMLMEVLNFPEINFDEQTAIHLLLDNKTMAECYFKKMETVQQNFFKSLPISFFMK